MIFFNFQMDQVMEFDFLLKLLIMIFQKKDYFFSLVKVMFLEELVFLILQLLHLIIMYFIFKFPINFHQNLFPNQFKVHLFFLLPTHFINLILLVFFLNQTVNQIYDLLKILNQIIINQMMVHPNLSKIISLVPKFIKYQIN